MAKEDFIDGVLSVLRNMDEFKTSYMDGDEQTTRLLQTRTNFAFFKDQDNSGLLTPWWEKTASGESMDPLAAGKELIVTSGLNLFMLGVNIANIFAAPCLYDDESDYSLASYWVGSAVGIPYLAAAFVIDIALAITALVTRTLASLVLGVDKCLEYAFSG